MEPPNSYKEVQKLTGYLVALTRFISKSGKRNLPFFKNLRRMSKENHVLRGAKERYPVIDKAIFPLFVSARKLKAYFESHPIQVVTDQPLKRVLTSPALSGRLTTYAIELSEFEISYIPRISVKAQALTDFVIDCTVRAPLPIQVQQDEEATDPKGFEWSMHVDRERNDK
ncbi:hypothetical protein LIER_32391 [Lithospermum erythrorhizon]|uniref:Reverse transcriptase RNase H-like domain-containing protein n=1 Tax=Lithospermum erythrorhizon TaxID=34254 RepID=A0AAV3RTR5_LITER